MHFESPHIRWIITTGILAVTTACGDGLGPGRDLTLNFCSPVGAVAVKNEDGSWSRVGSGASVTFRTGPRVALAIAYPVSSIVAVYYFTADEAAKTFSCPTNSDPPNNKTVSVSVRGLGTNEFGMIATPGNTHIHVPADFPLCCLPYEPASIIAWKSYEPPGQILPSVPRMIIRRAQNPPEGGTLPVFDFGAAEAFAPVAHTVSLVNAPEAPIFSQTDFRTADGVEVMVSADSTSTTSLVHHSVPTEKLAAGDLHWLRLGGGTRDVTLFYHTPADRDVVFGPLMASAAFTTVGNELHIDLPYQPEYGAQLSISMYADNGDWVAVSASSGYFGEPTNWSITIPDLSHIPEFAAAGDVSAPFTWTALVSSMPLTFRNTDARDGDTFRTAYLLGQRHE